jgi:PEGA domain
MHAPGGTRATGLYAIVESSGLGASEFLYSAPFYSDCGIFVRTNSPLTSAQSRWAIAVALVALLSATGCVRRRLTVRTQPPGAQVFVDDQEIGTTPCSSSFVYYGTRKVTLIKDGYRTETLYQKMNPPWYQIPPLDFVTDNLLIRELRDERIVDVQMVPQEIVPQARLLERANALRNGALTGQITLPPGAASPPPQFSLPGEGLPGGEPIPSYSLPAPAEGVERLPPP